MDMNIASRLLILTACCFVNANPFALVLTFGALYVPLLEKYNEDRARTATVQSLLMGVTMSTGIIWGMFCQKFGVSKVMFVGSVLVPLGYIVSFFVKSLYLLIFSIGVLAGIGTSIVHVCSSTVAVQTFEGKKAGAAIAVHNCAIGVGALAYPFLLDFLVHKYEIAEIFLLLGGLNLNNLVVALLIHYRRSRVVGGLENDERAASEESRTHNGKNFISWIVSVTVYVKNVLSDMMNVRLSVIIVATGVSVGCLNGFLVVVLDMFTSKGFSHQEGLDSFTVFNACSIIGRLLPLLSQLRKGMHPLAIVILCSVFGTAGQIVILKASGVSLMYLGSALSGIAIGGLISGASVALVHFLPNDKFDAAFGLMTTTIGLISSATGPIYGWMRDEMQAYDAVNGLTAGLLGLTALLCLITACVTNTVPEETGEEEPNEDEMRMN